MRCSSSFISSICAERLVIHCQTTSVSAAHATHCATHCTPYRPLIQAFAGWIRTAPPICAQFVKVVSRLRALPFSCMTDTFSLRVRHTPLAHPPGSSRQSAHVRALRRPRAVFFVNGGLEKKQRRKSNFNLTRFVFNIYEIFSDRSAQVVYHTADFTMIRLTRN